MATLNGDYTAFGGYEYNSQLYQGIFHPKRPLPGIWESKEHSGAGLQRWAMHQPLSLTFLRHCLRYSERLNDFFASGYGYFPRFWKTTDRARKPYSFLD